MSKKVQFTDHDPRSPRGQINLHLTQGRVEKLKELAKGYQATKMLTDSQGIEREIIVMETSYQGIIYDLIDKAFDDLPN